jgi:PAS domain S-box-containing protein
MSSDDRTVSAADISRNFGEWQSKALQSPVTITHHGRPRLMLLSIRAFNRDAADAGAADSASALATQHRSLLSQMREEFFALDENFLVTDINPAAELYFGMTRDALIGRDFRDTVPASRESFAWTMFQRVMTTGEPAEFKVKGSVRGRPRLNVRVFPYDGGVGVMYTTALVEEQASMLRTRGEALLKAMSCEPALSVAVLNARGGFELVDDAFCTLTGFSRAQLMSLTLVELAKAADQTGLTQALNATIRDGEPKALDLTVLHSSGEARKVRLTMGAAVHDVAPEEIVIGVLEFDRIGAFTGVA